MAESDQNIDWRTVIRRIKSNKFTPIISDRVFHPGPNRVIADWAKAIDFPYALDTHVTLAELAQYLAATSRDELSAKEDFLEFSKQYLLDETREAHPEQSDFLDTVEDELYDITFSEMAARLDYPTYEDEFDSPLRILAELPPPPTNFIVPNIETVHNRVSVEIMRGCTRGCRPRRWRTPGR